MAYDRNYMREYTALAGINLLENVIKQLQDLEIKLMEITDDFSKIGILSLEKQVQLVFGISADDKASRYLVYCLNMLNDHLTSEFPHREYALKLIRRCLGAVHRAVRSHSHIWNKAQLHAIITALGSAYVTKKKAFPYYYDDDKDNGNETKERKVLEYKEDDD
ncbi:MAG: hypothetical protein ACFE9S_15655 [Candidatus Hermodarchaeota archaeon]